MEIQLEKEKEGRIQAENKVIEISQEISRVNAEQRQFSMETSEKIRNLEFQLENSHKFQLELDSKLYSMNFNFFLKKKMFLLENFFETNSP